MRLNKLAPNLETEALKTYNIQALWQQSRDCITSKINSLIRLEQLMEL